MLVNVGRFQNSLVFEVWNQISKTHFFLSARIRPAFSDFLLAPLFILFNLLLPPVRNKHYKTR